VSARLIGWSLILCFLVTAGCGGKADTRDDGNTTAGASAALAGKEGLHAGPSASATGQRMNAGRMSSMSGLRDPESTSAR